MTGPEPVAIVGMACRFPRAGDLTAYWNLLEDGIEAVREPPAARTELVPPPWLAAQSPACARGGFLDNVDGFEPGFFRISPREAARMDPQQRLLLEVAWEALEDAGQPVARLAGSRTGVFVGLMNADFARRAALDLPQLDLQLGTGSSLGIASNRLSFALDLRGPSLTVDTLCSSSLVAVHLACQSLLADESAPLAIAGGANVILDRTMDVFYARAGLLAADGRCRAFDAGARGIVRGEGVGLVVLKRLSVARADGDRVHAVILGSAVNQDGRSNGLTSPNRFSQQEVLRAAYRRANVAPHRVAYVETHGTGTLLGDPIEAAALGAVIGDGRAQGSPCAIGSVKSNFGHLESAAGVASLIKAALSLERGRLAPSLHFESPNPHARLAERGLRVQTRAEHWPDAERIAGVSSFGMGGTNAHIVLAAAEPAPRMPRSGGVRVVPISARDEPALDDLTRRYVELAEQTPIEDLVYTAGARRDHHDHRRAIEAGSGWSISGTITPGRTYKRVFVLPTSAACDTPDVGELAAYQSALAKRWGSYGVVPDEVRRVASVDGLETALGEDATLFIELAPRPVLVEALRELLARSGAAGAVVSSISELGERESLAHALGQLFVLGVELDWARIAGQGAQLTSLGTYPWQRQPCALEAAPIAAEALLPHGVIVPGWIRADAPSAPRSAGDWIVVGNAALAAQLERAGQRVREVASVDELEHAGAARDVVARGDVSDAVRIVRMLARRSERLWLVTRGACVVGDGTTLDSIEAATVWGLARVAANEHPRLACTLVDVAAPPAASDENALVDELVSGSGEREVALRAGARYVARLGRLAPAWTTTRVQVRSDATYLITGGLGGLGIAAATRLVDRGAKRVLLVSRSGQPSPAARAAVDELTRRGATILVERADVADREALAEVVRGHRVRGVLHAAGVMTPGMVTALAPEDLPGALAAKVTGARNLHELLCDEPLDFFVLYSSIATLLGMHGQAAYAAGNAYLDALAAHRRSRGLPAVSVAWTVIADTGMATGADPKAIGQLADRGIVAMTVHQATDVLERVLTTELPANIGAVDFDVARWTSFYPHARAHPRLQALADQPSRDEMSPDPAALAHYREADRVAAIEVYLARTLAGILHHGGELPLDRSLLDLGLDSLTALELQVAIEGALGVSLEPEQLVRGASLRELAAGLAVRIGGSAVPTPVAVAAPEVDARLDPALVFAPRSTAARGRIFLTGATGFLGAFVLAELLERTSGPIDCLIRARDPAQAKQRIEQVLGRHGLPALALASRVTCIPGDLAQPHLGLPPEHFEQLAAVTDTIIHSGASVNFVFPYEALKASNVDGTREILRLAAAARARLHHVSTIGVFPAGNTVIRENELAAGPQRLPLGYMRAKWVAEQLVLQARDRGLPANIYRPGTIAGHATTGAFNPDDFVCVLIKGCLELGIAPDVDVAVNLVPVDYVSRALVQLVLDAPADIYHLVGRRAVAWRDLVEWIRALGYPLELRSYRDWRALLLERAGPTGNALAPLLPLFRRHEDTEWLRLPDYDDARAASALAHTDIRCPLVDAALVRRYVERFVIAGYVPRPS